MKALLLALVWLALSGTAVAAQDTPRSWCVSVWHPSPGTIGGDESIRANTDVINIVHPFWYSPTTDGTIYAHPGLEDPQQVAEWRDLGLTIIPSIPSSVFEMLSPAETRAFHVQQIVELVERFDYDGIDVDYEGFPVSTRDDFSAFIEELAAELHARGKLLTIAVHAKTDDTGTGPGAAAQDWERIAPAVDVFSIMTYDYTNRNEAPGPISPTDWALDVLAYAESVTDLSKVRLGLPFYGYSWKRNRPPAITVSWESIQPVIQSFKLEVQRDPGGDAYAELNARGLPRQTFYFADSAALEYKLEQVLATYPDIGGVAIWGIGGEDPANWDVLRAARPSNCYLSP
ncbi:MAG: glycoside hydrolase [Chloroflexi bacterium]|nr:glycoside hydrolase [Chloroflexota bacterium]